MKKSHYFLLILSLGLAGCDRVDTSSPKYEKKFQIPVNSKSIAVIYDLSAYSKLPKSQQLFAELLVENVEKWALIRLRPANLHGNLRFIIQEAALFKLPSSRKLREMEGRLVVLVTLHNDKGAVLSNAEVKISHKIPVPVNPTKTEFENLRKLLAVKIVDAFDVEVENTFLKMSAFIPLSGNN